MPVIKEPFLNKDEIAALEACLIAIIKRAHAGEHRTLESSDVKITVDEGILVQIAPSKNAIKSSALLGEIKGMSVVGRGRNAFWLDTECQKLGFSSTYDLALALNAGIKEQKDKIDLSAIELSVGR